MKLNLNRKFIKIACPIIVIGIGAICSGKVFYSKNHQPPMSEKQQEEFANLIANQVASGVSLEKLEGEMDKNIGKLDKKNATNVINTYIFNLYQVNTEYINILNEIKPMIDTVTQEKKIDVTKNENINKLEDGIVKGFLQELKKNHLILRRDADNYYISVDMQYILDTYGDRLSTDLTDFIKFRIEEDKTQVFNSDTQTFNLDEVAKRINEIEQSEKKYKDSTYFTQWESTKKYYYDIMFQTNHQFFIDKDGKIKKDVIDDYSKYIKQYNGTELAKNLTKIYDILSKDNNASGGKYLQVTNEIITNTFKDDSNQDNNNQEQSNQANSKLDNENNNKKK